MSAPVNVVSGLSIRESVEQHSRAATPEQLIALAYQVVQSFTDIGDQFQRRAVRGKPLEVHQHKWDVFANHDQGGMRIALRVQGQYVDQATFVAKTRAEGEEYAAALRQLLIGMPVPIPGEIHVPLRRGRPSLADGEAKDDRIEIRTTAERKKQAIAAAKAENMTLNVWLEALIDRAL